MAFLKEVVGNRYVFDCNRADDLELVENITIDRGKTFCFGPVITLELSPDDKTILVHSSGASPMDIQAAVHLLRLLINDGVV